MFKIVQNNNKTLTGKCVTELHHLALWVAFYPKRNKGNKSLICFGCVLIYLDDICLPCSVWSQKVPRGQNVQCTAVTIYCTSASVRLWSCGPGNILFVMLLPFNSSDLVACEVNSKYEQLFHCGAVCHLWHQKRCLVINVTKSEYEYLLLIPESSGLIWRLDCCMNVYPRTRVFLLFNQQQQHSSSPFLCGATIQAVPSSSSIHGWVSLQGCVFCVFVLLCLIDSNMGFLNALSSDLFPQERMTQNDFKDAWWESRSLWSDTTGFVEIYPADLNQNFKVSYYKCSPHETHKSAENVFLSSVLCVG